MAQTEWSEQFLEFPETQIAAVLVYILTTAPRSIQCTLPRCAHEWTMFSLTKHQTSQTNDVVKKFRSDKNCNASLLWALKTAHVGAPVESEELFLRVYLQKDDKFFFQMKQLQPTREYRISCDSCDLDLSSRCAVLLLLTEKSLHFTHFSNCTISPLLSP